MVQWLKKSTYNAEDTGDDGSIPGSGRSPGGENGNPRRYSYLENPMDRGAWQATVRRVAKSQTGPSMYASIQPVLFLLLVIKENEEMTWGSCQKVKRGCGQGHEWTDLW